MTQTTDEHEQEMVLARTEVNEDLDRLERFPAELEDLLKEQPREALDYRPSEDSWSIKEILGYLIVVDARWGNRIRQMLSANEVRFVIMEADEAVQQFGFQNQAADDIIAGFTERRAERMTSLRGLTSDDLDRSGTHPDHGTVTVADTIARLSQNDAHSRQQIEDVLKAYHQGQSTSHSAS